VIPDWSGQTVAILASGPSMSSMVAESVRDLPCIAVNNTFRLAPWAGVIYAHDAQWWEHPSNKDAHKAPGLKIGCEPTPGVFTLRNTGWEGFDPDPSCIRVAGNSGYQAVHLAMHASASRILLLGFDMKGGHWHGPHPYSLSNPIDAFFTRWVQRFATLVPAARQMGVEIINCTPGSAIECFPRMTVEECIA